MTDPELWDQFRSGDREALAALYQRHRPAILRATQAILGCSADAEDAAETAFLRATEEASRRRPVHSFRGWIRRVARNSAIDIRRAPRAAGDPEAIESAPASVASAPGAAAERHEWRAALIAELRDLPIELREPLLLHFFADCSLTEIGLIVGLPKSTVQHRYETGIARLRRRLSRFSVALIPALLAWITSRVARAQAAGTSATSGATVAMTSKALWSTSALILVAVGVGIWSLNQPEKADAIERDSQRAIVGSSMTLEPARSSSLDPSEITATPFRDEAAEPTLPAPAPGIVRISGLVRLGNEPAPAGTLVQAAALRGWRDVRWDAAMPEGALTVELRTTTRGQFHWDLPPLETAVTIGLSSKAEGFSSTKTSFLLRRSEGAPSPVILQLQPLDGILKGTVLAPSGEPISGATVSAGVVTTVADDLGRFQLPVSSIGRSARVQARAAGFGSVAIPYSPPTRGQSSEVTLRLAPEILVKGRVLDHEQRPLAGVRARAHAEGVESATPTGFDGRFLIRGVARTERILVAANWDETLTETVLKSAPHPSELEVDFTLPALVRVDGHVVDEDGRGLEAICVSAGPSETRDAPRTLTDASGHFLFTGVRAKSFNLEVYGPKISFQKVGLKVGSPATDILGLRITAKTSQSVSGITRDERGEPVAGAYVTMQQSHDYIPLNARTDSRGQFQLHGVPDSPDLVLEIYKPRYVRARLPVRAGQAGLEVSLPRAAGLAGRVVDAGSDEPVTQYRVRLVPPDVSDGESEGTNYWADLATKGVLVSDRDGIWRIDDEELTAGHLFGVEISAPGFATAVHRRVVSQVAPDPATCIIRLVKSAEVRLRIIADSDGRLIRAAAVRALTPSEVSRFFEWPDFDGAGWQRSDDRGNVVLDSLAPGTYHFEVRAEGFPPRLLGPFVVAAPSTEIALALAGGASIRGRALDVRGQPRARVELDLQYEDGATPQPRFGALSATTDVDGSFEFRGLLPGEALITHSLALGNLSHFAESHPVTIPAAGVIDVLLQPKGTARLEITFDPSPRPDSSYALRLQRESPLSHVPTSRAVALTDNSAFAEGLEAGVWSIHLLDSRGFTTPLGTVTLSDHQSQSLRLSPP